MSIPTNIAINPTRPSAMRWGAIMAGLLIAVVSGILMNLLGIGFGLVTLPVTGASASTLSGAAIGWYVASGSIAMYLGGWTTGFFSHTFHRIEGVLYGVTTWALATLLGIMFTLFGASSIIGGAASMVTGSLSASKNSMKMVSKPLTLVVPNLSEAFETVSKQVNALIDNVSNSNVVSNLENGPMGQKLDGAKKNLQGLLSNNTRFELTQAVNKFLSADQEQMEQAKQKVLDIMTKNTELTREDAEKVIKDWQDYYTNMKKFAKEKAEEAKQQAKELAETSSRAVGSAAIGVFFMLVAGALASSYGSLLGARAQARDSDVRKCCSN
jgi:hypothetical protein